MTPTKTVLETESIMMTETFKVTLTLIMQTNIKNKRKETPQTATKTQGIRTKGRIATKEPTRIKRNPTKETIIINGSKKDKEALVTVIAVKTTGVTARADLNLLENSPMITMGRRGVFLIRNRDPFPGKSNRIAMNKFLRIRIILTTIKKNNTITKNSQNPLPHKTSTIDQVSSLLQRETQEIYISNFKLTLLQFNQYKTKRQLNKKMIAK